MDETALALIETLRRMLEDVPGLRTARLVRPGQRVEVPLARYPAALLEPAGTEDVAWPDAPLAVHRLVHWRVRVLDRALPGTRAFEALLALAGAARTAALTDPTRGGSAEDGPPSVRDTDLRPEAGATRLSRLALGEAAPGEPTALTFRGTCGWWVEPQAAAATFAGQNLFASGPHAVRLGSPTRRTVDRAFNGLRGGLTIDLGDGPREIVQTGVLSAEGAETLSALAEAVELYVSGRTHTLVDPDGQGHVGCRLERFERLGSPLRGTGLHQPYRITYRQLAR